MEEEILEGKLFATFEGHGDFSKLQQSCLELDLFENPSEEDDMKEYFLFKRIFDMLDEYQEQSYLLDPYLESLVVPVVESLRTHTKVSVAKNQRGSPKRVERLARLLYSYIKLRGYKTIIRFFPHEIADLSIALEALVSPAGLIHEPFQWALRYVVLVWLSLVCIIPFDLAQFDEVDRAGYTMDSLESSAKVFLGKAGLDREGAALLLSRLYMRKDASSRFPEFLEWSKIQIDKNADIFMTIGILQVLCEVMNSASVEQVRLRASQIFEITDATDKKPLSSNAVVRKFRIKLLSRAALRLLPAPLIGRRKGRVLTGNDINEDCVQELNIDVPEEVEQVLEQLFEALQDRDTIVRWSAAKGVARISERLPLEFADQVLETIMGLFSIHSITAASLYDLPATAESPWHGACLACAEMARRSLVASKRLPELIEWLSKALYFDLRKGAHSIGANVRDAAAYVLWALARTQDPASLESYSQNLARHLTTVALYDREIHIRRAASAAFQEHVGRNNLFPHGIDVLGKTDFYAVSIRRNAFLMAAPLVAQHTEYRFFLLNHILDVVLRHWDSTMRELGSQSLRLICLIDLTTLGPEAVTKSTRLLESPDISDIHGGLLALSEVAMAYRDSGDAGSREVHMREIFWALSRISFDVVVGSRNAIVTAAACRLISITLTLPEIQSDPSPVPHWRKIIDHGLKHRTTSVQEAAADAVASVSKLVDSSATIKRLIRELSSSPPIIQQSLGTVLGAVDYSAHTNALPEATQCLLEFVKPSSPPKQNVEARRNCYAAFSRILSTVIGNVTQYLTAEVVNSFYDSLLNGLNDYSMDERGDVGSWIRVSCVQGLTAFSEMLIQNANSIPALETYLPPSKLHAAISGILKQGVERLDNVRQESGECIRRLLALPLPVIDGYSPWSYPGSQLLNELFNCGETPGWNEAPWLFPRALRLLEISEYRSSVLTGFVLTIGCKTDSTQRPLATSLVSYAKSLPLSDQSAKYDVNTLIEDLISQAKSQIMSNAIVIPILQTFNVLLEADALSRLSEDSRGLRSLEQLITLFTRNISRLKSVPRIHETMKLVVHLLPFQPLFEKCVLRLVDFLGHDFPRVRSNCAEFLYVFLQGTDIGRDTDEVEEMLLETEWSSTDQAATKEATQRLTDLFLRAKLMI